ncbi:putative response regulator [Oxalobacteraceae bacterium IMCC9480]|nr:putative response regulator [Oxalobacteraceae bacterium IMCC9480]NDP60723.1 response regulator transcription factor [Oxalobacteraceae bacterium]
MLKVVIIDGNSITRNLLSTLLVAGGHDVIGDSNTSDAGLARAIKLQPQIVCIDIGETSDQGFGMLDLLRESLPKALIFLVSGNMDPAIVQGASQRGIHGFIVKPFNPVTVQTIIRNAILKIARQQQARATAATEAATPNVKPIEDAR